MTVTGVHKRWSGIEVVPSKKPGIMVNAHISMCNKSKCEEVFDDIYVSFKFRLEKSEFNISQAYNSFIEVFQNNCCKLLLRNQDLVSTLLQKH